MMNNDLKKELKKYIENREYNKCNYILNAEITSIYTNKIKEKNSNFKYTTLNNLKSNVEKYLNENEKSMFYNFYDTCIIEENNLQEFYILAEIIKNLN